MSLFGNGDQGQQQQRHSMMELGEIYAVAPEITWQHPSFASPRIREETLEYDGCSGQQPPAFHQVTQQLLEDS